MACRLLSRAATWSRAARRSRSLRRTLSSCSASCACAPLNRPSTPRRAVDPQAHQAWPARPPTHHRAPRGLPVWTHGVRLTREGPPKGDRSPTQVTVARAGMQERFGPIPQVPLQLLRAERAEQGPRGGSTHLLHSRPQPSAAASPVTSRCPSQPPSRPAGDSGCSSGPEARPEAPASRGREEGKISALTTRSTPQHPGHLVPSLAAHTQPHPLSLRTP